MAQAAKTKRIFDNRYEILSIVGRGHVSVVYHAVHLKAQNSEVALKVLVNRKDQKASAERLRKEALAMVSSRHRYVVRLDDFHSMGDLCYLSMEFAPESDLRRYVERLGKRLPVPQVETYLSQIAQALSFVHKVGIIHRDIKADNILVINERESRLADFSVAVLPGEESSLEELQTGVGTMAYMAPEVLEGKAYETSSDLYALGVTFYELLTGTHPFDSAPLSQQLDIRREGGFAHVLDLAPDVPRYLADLVMRAMRYDRALRFSSAEEMVSLLNASIQAKETPAAPVKAGPIGLTKPSVEIVKPKDLASPVAVQPAKSDPAPATAPSTSGIRKTRYASKMEQMRKERTAQEETVETPAAVPSSEVTQRIDRPVKTSPSTEPAPPEESPTESSVTGRVSRRPRGRTPTEKIDQAIVDQIRAARAQEPQPLEPTPAKPAERVSVHEAPEGTVAPTPSASPQHSEPLRASNEAAAESSARRALPWKPLLGALVALVAVYYWRFAAPGTPEPQASQSVTSSAVQPSEPARPDTLIPSVTDQALSFPELPAGAYHGVLQGFVPGREAPLTFVSIPGKRLLVILIGVAGMSPTMIDLDAWQRRAEESGNRDSLRVAANGQVLEFSGKQIDDSLQGSFANLVTGEEGTWFVRPMREGGSR